MKATTFGQCSQISSHLVLKALIRHKMEFLAYRTENSACFCECGSNKIEVLSSFSFYNEQRRPEKGGGREGGVYIFCLFLFQNIRNVKSVF